MPSPTPSGSEEVAPNHPPLTDQDVGLLHLIITTASHLPEAGRFPFRALFDAYHSVLRDHGLDPDHDPLYFRYLLRVGGVPGEGPLYQKFETLLAEMGIRIEFDGEDHSPPAAPALGAPQSDEESPDPTSAPLRGVAGDRPGPRGRSADSAHERLEALAARRDRDTLLRQAWETWRQHGRERRQRLQTAQYFWALERRAERARNLFLVSKAFTHWVQSTADEVERVRIARRHVLRTKYFQAWRAITIANAQTVVVAQSTARATYHHQLVRKLFWHWFWTFCERRAPDWHASRTKKSFLTKWIDAVQERREREGWVEGMRRRLLLKQCFGRWTARSRQQTEQAHTAARYRQTKIIAHSLGSLAIQTKLAPRASEVANRVDWRVARTSLQRLLHRARAEKQAAAVCRRRQMKNAWTAWNDRLRWQSLATRIDERVTLQALYKWTLAQRAVLLHRVCAQRLQQRRLVQLVERSRTRREQRAQAETTLGQQRDQRLLSGVMGRWRLQMQLHDRRETLAFQYHAPGVVQESFLGWQARNAHVQQLGRDAAKARFYFLATQTLGRWQTAMVESRREKRRGAYAQVRRRVKMECARAALRRWRERSAQHADLTRLAHEVEENRLVVHGMNLLDRWRARHEDTAEMATQAQTLYQRRTRRTLLQTWQRRRESQRELEAQATYRANIRVANVAAGLLRRLGMQAFQHGNLERSATKLLQRNDKKHLRTMLRYWRERCVQHGHPFFSGGWAGSDAGLDSGAIPLDWGPGTASGPEATAAPSLSSPMPGYLSTPSKRAARAQALVRLTTTPGTPRTPGMLGTPRVPPLRLAFSHRLVGQARSRDGEGSATGFMTEPRGRRPGDSGTRER
ncbi:MAG: hypothetical protein M1838_003951 [Thelocarpon superellum]|nr:MAG: hypothetical protein M1838_003951 [Thelocarpon superellum]